MVESNSDIVPLLQHNWTLVSNLEIIFIEFSIFLFEESKKISKEIRITFWNDVKLSKRNLYEIKILS